MTTRKRRPSARKRPVPVPVPPAPARRLPRLRLPSRLPSFRLPRLTRFLYTLITARSTSSATAVAPRQVIGESTCLIPWPQYLVRAVRKHPLPLLVGIAAAIELLLVAYAAQLVALVPAALIAPMAGFLLCGLTATRPVVLFLKSSTGHIYVSEERWWKRDVLTWPDSLKFSSASGRTLWLDLTGTTPVPFDPEQAPRDREDGNGWVATTAQFADIDLAARAYRAKFQWDSPLSDTIKLGLAVAVIIASLFAMFLAGDRAIQTFTGAP